MDGIFCSGTYYARTTHDIATFVGAAPNYRSTKLEWRSPFLTTFLHNRSMKLTIFEGHFEGHVRGRHEFGARWGIRTGMVGEWWPWVCMGCGHPAQECADCIGQLVDIGVHQWWKEDVYCHECWRSLRRQKKGCAPASQ